MLALVGWLLGLVGGCDRAPPPARHLGEAIARHELPAEEADALRALLHGTGLTPDDIALAPEGSPAWATVGQEGLRTLALPTPPADLAPVDRLAQLDRLDLAKVGAVPVLPTCGVRELRLAGLSADADLAPLGACAQLEQLYLQGDLTTLATLPALPSLTKLVVTRTPLRDLEGLAGRARLTTLHVEHGDLHTVEGLRDVPALASLALPHQPLTEVPALPHLPRLRQLNLAHTEVRDVAALQPLLAQLEQIDLSHTPLEDAPPWLVGADGVVLSGTPLLASGRAWEMTQQALAEERRQAYDEALAEWDRPRADSYPSGHLSLRSVTGSCRSYGRKLQCEGRADTVRGAGVFSLRTLDPADASPTGSDKAHPHPVRLRVSVSEGRARVFLRPDERGAPYVDVVPGAPAAIRGHLLVHATQQGFAVQALDGDVTGFTYALAPID